MEDSIVRVLHCVVNLNRGGAETLLMNLYRNMNREKVQFDFLTSREGVYDEEVKAKGGRIFRIPYMTQCGPVAYAHALRHFFASHPEYRIVHSHMDKMSGLVLREARRCGVPIRIAHSHNTQSEGNLAVRAIKNYYGRAIRSCATQRFACSQAAAEWLFGEQAGEALIWNNGIQVEDFCFSPSIRQAVRRELGIPESALLLGHVGRFHAQKNHAFLVGLMEQLHAIRPDAALLLVGEGPLLSKIKETVAEKGLRDSVLFLGSRGDVNRLLQAMDIFVFPSLHEGLPVTLIEAQASALPCLVSNRITQEVDLGYGLVRFLPIEETAPWIEQLRQCRPGHAGSVVDLAGKGYDIRLTAEKLTEFYLSKIRSGR